MPNKDFSRDRARPGQIGNKEKGPKKSSRAIKELLPQAKADAELKASEIKKDLARKPQTSSQTKG